VRELATELDEAAERDAMERGLQSLVNQHGLAALLDNVKRLSKGH